MILTFKSDVAYRKKLMAPGCMAHPAKCSLPLLYWLVERYCKPGDLVIDVMAGSASTLLVCADLGIDSIGIEYEPHFVEIAKKNIEHLQRSRLFSLGKMQIVRGDARALPFKSATVALFSPPYGNVIRSGNEGNAIDMEKLGKYGPNSQIVVGSTYGQGEGQIGNLSIAIFSPPYGGSEAVDNRKTQNSTIHHHGGGNATREKYADGAISNLQYGVDVIATSPPYGNRLADTVVDDGDEARMGYQQATGENDKTNIGSDEIDEKGRGTYLAEMLKVYQECFRVIKPGGLMILVTKNFYRKGVLVPLDEHTIRLCEMAGFSFRERHGRKILNLSFWVRLRANKGLPIVDVEDILVFDRNF